MRIERRERHLAQIGLAEERLRLLPRVAERPVEEAKRTTSATSWIAMTAQRWLWNHARPLWIRSTRRV